jgi:hypothetical protein
MTRDMRLTKCHDAAGYRPHPQKVPEKHARSKLERMPRAVRNVDGLLLR